MTTSANTNLATQLILQFSNGEIHCAMAKFPMTSSSHLIGDEKLIVLLPW